MFAMYRFGQIMPEKKSAERIFETISIERKYQLCVQTASIYIPKSIAILRITMNRFERHLKINFKAACSIQFIQLLLIKLLIELEILTWLLHGKLYSAYYTYMLHTVCSTHRTCATVFCVKRQSINSYVWGNVPKQIFWIT